MESSKRTSMARLVFGLYVLTWTVFAVHGKALDVSQLPASSPTEVVGSASDLLPPLIFPTDKQKNNIVPINKTAIKILLHEDEWTKEKEDNKGTMSSPTKIEETRRGEAEDLRKTDEKIALSEEEHAKYFKEHHDQVAMTEDKTQRKTEGGYKDEVENIQEVNSKLTDLEEQFNRPTYMSVNIVNMNPNGTVHDHMAWFSVLTVGILALMIFSVLMFWRKRLEQRYGNRHQLFTDENESVHDNYV